MPSKATITRRRWRLYLLQDGICFYCKQPMTLHPGSPSIPTRVTVDHLVPLSQGGRRGYTNEVAACHGCNSKRGTRDWIAFYTEKAEERGEVVVAAPERPGLRDS